MSEIKDKLSENFERSFNGYQRELTGTEQEIMAFKLLARQWFEAGVREAAAIFYNHGMNGLKQSRSEVDEHFNFMNNG